jgi:membrane peptidoglycan carboxypeptidase
LEGADDYPVALDVALPTYSNVQVFQNKQFKSLFYKEDSTFLSYLKPLNPPFYLISKDTLVDEVYLRKGDHLKVERVSAKQIREAIEESIESGKLKRGASTITQQMVKNVFLSQEKSLIRKARELWLATKVEKVLGKKKILEIYLNIAEWGEGIFGIGRASQHYFHKSASELTAKEGAFLAMLLPSPKKYSISFRKKELTRYARKTVNSILNKLVSANVLTYEQKQVEWNTPLSFEVTQAANAPDPAKDTVDDEEDDLPSD